METNPFGVGNYLDYAKEQEEKNKDKQNSDAELSPDLLGVDEVGMLFGDPYHLTDKITIYTPTVGDIKEFGEQNYFSVISTLVAIPSDMKSRLEDVGINYMEISDFELFMMISRGLTKDQTSIILGDLDFSKMIMCENSENGDIVLYDPESDIMIDKLVYAKMVSYIRKMNCFGKPKIEHAANETTRRILIQLDREKIAKAKKEPYKSQLRQMISAMMRYPGFKYKMSELKECGIYEFMDTYQGSQIYVQSTALLQGSYSGMIDTSKINKKEFDFMRSVE